MTDAVKQKRSACWDNIKGVLIILVVFAHILFQLQTSSDIINGTVDIIYMFHMPAFVFISGFFGKSERSRSAEGIIRLLFLYFIFNSAMGFMYGFRSLLIPMYSYWYLIALAVWRLTAHHIAKIKEINLILFVTALFAGFYPSIDNTFCAARIIGFYPYYMCGYMLTAEKSAELCSKNRSKRLPVGVLCLTGAAAVMYGAYRYFQYTDDALQMAAYDAPQDAFGRICLYAAAFLAIYALRCLAPQKSIPLLTKFGRNSLWIFILHRPLTLLVSKYMKGMGTVKIMLAAAAVTLLICLVCGSDFVKKYLDRFADGGTEIFSPKEGKKLNFSAIAALAAALGFVVSVVVQSYSGFGKDDIKKMMNGEYTDDEQDENDDEDIIYPVMSDAQAEKFESAFRITFAGDLILLEDQVKRAYNGSGYDFTEVFEYASPYISSADYAIGVFEGPMAGEEAGYTTGNFDDGKELRLNFPDTFAEAVREAGFDLVTTANNHLLDKGEAGALRTIEVLDRTGLDHTGSYTSEEDKRRERIKLVECQGIRIAVLSYTYGCNYISNELLTEGRFSYLTSVIYGTEGEEFEKMKKSVEEDMRAAKEMSPDLIVVLPHIGTQFSNTPDKEQETWFEIFKQNGADIILGDHPHVAEPARVEEYDGRKVFVGYCPGNFANIYREDQGDTSMLTDVYIDRDTKEVIGGSVVPLYTHARADGNYRAVPVYEIMHSKELRAQLTTDDIEKAADANAIITEVVFGSKMDITSLTERLYFDEKGFIRTKASGLDITDDLRAGLLYRAMEKADTICFVGDSVTEGTKNGGCPWYEPIEAYFGDKQIGNYSKGGCTVSYMTDHADDIPKAGLYVIALGTNDVRYRDEKVCAMTAESYTANMGTLRDKLKAKSPDAEFIFIAPWYSTDGDPYCKLKYAQKTALNDEYSAALEKWCSENSCGYINANAHIREKLAVTPDRTYLLDHIHPNASDGVVMYSEAALKYPA